MERDYQLLKDILSIPTKTFKEDLTKETIPENKNKLRRRMSVHVTNVCTNIINGAKKELC
mgnify:CR=1 FL=1